MKQTVEQHRGTYTVDEFIRVFSGAEPKYELVNGRVQELPSELSQHFRIKGYVYVALLNAIRRGGAPLECFVDGATLRIDDHRARRPDVLVARAGATAADTVFAAEPVVIVEVLSPSSRAQDLGAKVDEYFCIETVQDYLVADPDAHLLTVFRRGDGKIARSEMADGALWLADATFSVDVSEFWSLR